MDSLEYIQKLIFKTNTLIDSSEYDLRTNSQYYKKADIDKVVARRDELFAELNCLIEIEELLQ